MRNPLGLALVLLAVSHVHGGDLLPAEKQIPEAIDHYIQTQLEELKLKAAPTAKPETLLRRTMLDLIGRPPTWLEIVAYLKDTDSNRRMAMVDRLIANPAFVEHQSIEFNTQLMLGVGGDLKPYLKNAFESKRPWDKIFRDLVLAEVDEGDRKGADSFIKSRVSDLDKLTNDSSVAFFGVNVSCAQCHDHPVVPEWTQDHFYGMKSFFSRTFQNGGFVAERAYGTISYKTTEGETRKASLQFLTGDVVEEPEFKEPNNDQKKKEKAKLEEAKKKKQPPPKPAFSRRAALVEFALKPKQQHFFARSIVNRVWYRMIGYGLVMPLDQMHPGNKSSHPKLLDWLARDFVANGYDIRRLIRGIALSDAYARASQWPDKDRPERAAFAVGNIRPLTPMQYASTLVFSSRNPDYFKEVESKPEELAKRIQQVASSAKSLASLFEQPSEAFQVSVTEALVLSNSRRIQGDLLKDGSKQHLLHKLIAEKDSKSLIRTAYQTAFGREPEAEELAVMQEFIASRKDRKSTAIAQLVWAMLTSAENRFNY